MHNRLGAVLWNVYSYTFFWHKPKHLADLLEYKMIIMGASLGCHEGKWLTYDRHFHLKASASNLK